MHKDKFYRSGKLIYHSRWAILITCFILVLFCLPLMPKVMDQFKAIGFVDPNSESALTDAFLKKNLDFYYNRFIIMYQSERSFAKNPDLMQEIKNSLANLKRFPLKYEILYPSENPEQISANKKTAYAVVLIKSNAELSDEMIAKFKSLIKKPPHLIMSIGGQPIFLEDTKKQTEVDLIKAEYIATPAAIITLLIVFGSVIAALIPIFLDGVCALLILTILFILGHYFALSVFTLNIALLLGLCLSLDYALFIISRFRDELAEGHDVKEALAITEATAGKAVFFSGLAVLISLSALLMFPINILFSVGMGGMTAVAVAVIISVVVLPAMLAILNHRINMLPIRLFKSHRNVSSGYWYWLVTHVVKKPWRYFCLIMAILLIMGYPLLSIELGLSDFRILPKELQSRKVFDTFQKDFNENELNPIIVTVKANNENFLTKNNIGRLYQLTDNLRRDKRIDKIESIVNTDPRLSKAQYQMLYTQDNAPLSPNLEKLLKLTTEDNFTTLTIISKYPSNSKETKELIEKIRDHGKQQGFKIKVTGTTATTIDVFHRIDKLFPYAFAWIIALTFLILLILLRSLVLPIKAIIMNMLSLFASYGVLVFIIQKGYLSGLLNFDPQGMIDISLVIIIFCALFGFSMDYEVFLLSRIKEEYERTGKTNRSVCYGIVHSSKIITSAAIIVILICFSFLSANILLVKAFGLGIAVAIFVDAFLIRTLLVPATLAILQKWSWYLPKWLDRILPKMAFNLKDDKK